MKKLNKKLKELERKCRELKQEIETLKNDASEKNWPHEKSIYFTLEGEGKIKRSYWRDDYIDIFRKQSGNCFMTEEEAETYKETLIVTQMLRDIAEELNDGVEIDWNNREQKKYFIFYDYYILEIGQCYYSRSSSIFCLSNRFKDVAIKRIGLNRLTKYLKNY